MQGTVAVKEATLLEAALDEGSLSLFVQAVRQAGLEELLAGDQYTVFAPNDAAFQHFAKGTIDELMGNTEELMTLLSYHIVTGKYTEDQLCDIASIQSLLGKDIPVNCSRAGGSKIDQASVIEPSIECSNGIIHVIDQVLVPK